MEGERGKEATGNNYTKRKWGMNIYKGNKQTVPMPRKRIEVFEVKLDALQSFRYWIHVSGHFYSPVALPPGKSQLRYPVDCRLGEPNSRFIQGCEIKNSYPARNPNAAV